MQIFSEITNQINKYGNMNYMKIISSSRTKPLAWGMFVMFQYKNLLIKKKFTNKEKRRLLNILLSLLLMREI